MLNELDFVWHDQAKGEHGEVIWAQVVQLQFNIKGAFFITSTTTFALDEDEIDIDSDEDDEDDANKAKVQGEWKLLSEAENSLQIELIQHHSYQTAIIQLADKAKWKSITLPRAVIWPYKDGEMQLDLADNCENCTAEHCCWRCKNEHGR
jgi:hypothetical protein